MATVALLPCQPWTTVERMCCEDVPDVRPACDDNGDPIPAQYPWTDAELIVMSSNILFQRTGRRFPGICEGRTLRPCTPCRGCGERCDCRYEYVPLAGTYPVTEVTEVLIDGVVRPPETYRVDEFARLVRTDGLLWPRWQDLNADPSDTGADSFQITFNHGREVPSQLQYAAALLACELKRACNGQSCSLPDNVRSVVRDGVSYDIVNAEDIAINGGFGNAIIDTIVQDYTPKTQRPRMTSRMMHPLMEGTAYDRNGVRGY